MERTLTIKSLDGKKIVVKVIVGEEFDERKPLMVVYKDGNYEDVRILKLTKKRNLALN